MTITDIIVSSAEQSSRFRKALRILLDLECEFEPDGIRIRSENVQGDSGGLTFCGIDHASFPAFPFESPTPFDVWQTYKREYWDLLSCDTLPTPVGEMLFLQSVNLGIGRSVRLLQEALNDYGSHLTIDGRLGDNTKKAAWACPTSQDLGNAFLAKTLRQYKEIAVGEKAKFLTGWTNRVEQIRKAYT